MQRLVFKALLVIALLYGTACSHYRLGTGAERSFDTIFVPAVETQGIFPQATAIFTTQLREAFIRDGRLRVVNTPEEADVIISVKLDGFRRARLTALPADTGLTRKFGMELNATCTLTQTKGGKPLFTDRPISVERQIFTENGTGLTSATIVSSQQTQAEYQVLPQLAEPLAAKVRSAVLDTW